eukprot:8294540-Heterocapsa_arctica.AAC.1
MTFFLVLRRLVEGVHCFELERDPALVLQREVVDDSAAGVGGTRREDVVAQRLPLAFAAEEAHLQLVLEGARFQSPLLLPPAGDVLVVPDRVV